MKTVPIMYHGTDARIIRMSNDERMRMKDMCKMAAEYLWGYYKPLFEFVARPYNHLNQKGCTSRFQPIEQYKDTIISTLGNQDYVELLRALGYASLSLDNQHEQYQYEHLYLTNNHLRATGYAESSFAFGEIGFIAYNLLRAVDVIGFDDFNPDDEMKSAFGYIRSFAESKPEPVIITIENLECNNMLRDNGQIIDWDSPIAEIHLQMVRYIGDIQLTLDNAEYL